MNNKAINLLISLLAVGLISCAVFIAQQNTKLNAQQQQIADLESQIYRVQRALEISEASRTTVIKMRSLASGIYELSTEVNVDPFEDKRNEYTIYNFVLDINVGAVRRKLQFGYAYSGLLTHVIYFDHDSDGVIDTSMMNQYAKSIPGLDFAAGWLIDPEHSQSVYDAFRLNVDSVTKLTMDNVSNTTNKTVALLWEWLNDSSEDIANWIEDAVQLE